jgi:hypothetical protein
MATRRVRDFVFVRASDIILPNIGQFTGGSNNADSESFSIGCGRTRWAVPIDDENSHYIGYVYFNDQHKRYGELKESDLGVGKAGFIGQTADRPYEERQREPGDYDAVASQGAIANRNREHLGTTDRGVVLFRRMLARAIQVVAEGRVPELPKPVLSEGAVATYAHEYSIPIPGATALASQEALHAFGRRAAEIVVEARATQEPERTALERIHGLFEEKVQ